MGFYHELLSFGFNVWACDADAVFVNDPRPMMRQVRVHSKYIVRKEGRKEGPSIADLCSERDVARGTFLLTD